MSPAPAGLVHFVVPVGIDDPRRVSGGNICDRHVRDGLMAIGWDVRMIPTDPDAAAHADAVFAGLPDGALVLIDGLVASRLPAAVEAVAGRLRIVVIAHMVAAAFADADPQTVDGERRMLRAVRRVIATSEWTRSELTGRDVIPPGRIVVATPGTDEAPVSGGTPTGCALLCVGVVAVHKGQDLLIDALTMLGTHASWTCTIAGPLDVSSDYADRLARRIADADLGERVTMAGTLAEDDLDRAYENTDLVVAPSRVESYGMAIAEALRRGIPVLATRVGGIPQTVAGSRAAVLVPPDEPKAMSDALRRWMSDPALRARLKEEARLGAANLPRWNETADRIAATLAGVR